VISEENSPDASSQKLYGSPDKPDEVLNFDAACDASGSGGSGSNQGNNGIGIAL